jgi:hypothetical protein
MAREPAVWFLMIDGEQAGPMNRAEVGLQIASGNISAETFVWKDGMIEWRPGGEVPDLAQLFEPGSPEPKVKPPPPPPAAFKVKFKGKHRPESGRQGFSELNPAHFRVNGPPADDAQLSLEMPLVAETKRAARNEEEEDKDRTNVEALPFGERVHQEEVASSLFDGPAPEITGAGRALDYARYDSKSGLPKSAQNPKPLARPAPTPAPRAATPPPTALAPPARKNKVLIVAVVVAALTAIAGLIFVLG